MVDCWRCGGLLVKCYEPFLAGPIARCLNCGARMDLRMIINRNLHDAQMAREKKQPIKKKSVGRPPKDKMLRAPQVQK